MSAESSRKLFVGGLSYATTQGALGEYFSAFGPVADVVVMKDAISRRSRGFGFVTFASADSVQKALEEGVKHVIDDREVDAKLAVPRSDITLASSSIPGTKTTERRNASSPTGERRPSAGSLPASRRNSNQSIGSNGSTFAERRPSSAVVSLRRLSGVSVASSNFSDSSDQQPSSPSSTSRDLHPCIQSKCKLFVGGLHFATRDPDFLRYFEEYGPVSSSQVLFNRETGKSRGFGFVIFKDEESVAKVMAQPTHVIDNKEVEIKVAVPRPPGNVAEPSTKSTKIATGAKSTDARSDAPPTLKVPSSPAPAPAPPAPSRKAAPTTAGFSYASALRVGTATAAASTTTTAGSKSKVKETETQQEEQEKGHQQPDASTPKQKPSQPSPSLPSLQQPSFQQEAQIVPQQQLSSTTSQQQQPQQQQELQPLQQQMPPQPPQASQQLQQQNNAQGPPMMMMMIPIGTQHQMMDGNFAQCMMQPQQQQIQTGNITSDITGNMQMMSLNNQQNGGNANVSGERGGKGSELGNTNGMGNVFMGGFQPLGQMQQQQQSQQQLQQQQQQQQPWGLQPQQQLGYQQQMAMGMQQPHQQSQQGHSSHFSMPLMSNMMGMQSMQNIGGSMQYGYNHQLQLQQQQSQSQSQSQSQPQQQQQQRDQQQQQQRGKSNDSSILGGGWGTQNDFFSQPLSNSGMQNNGSFGAGGYGDLGGLGSGWASNLASNQPQSSQQKNGQEFGGNLGVNFNLQTAQKPDLNQGGNNGAF